MTENRMAEISVDEAAPESSGLFFRPEAHTTCSTGCISISKVSRNFEVMM
jgi:hypothetical protein